MRCLRFTLLAVALLSAPARAEVMIRVAGGQVDLTATAAPLNEILDRLARQTGMKVVYEGPAPRQAVSISLHGRSPAEAVLSLLEGLGLNYALVADTTGTKVQTLILSGAGPASSVAARPGSSGSAPPAAAARRPFFVPPAAAPDFTETPEDATDEESPEPEGMPGEIGAPNMPGIQVPEGVNPPGLASPTDPNAAGSNAPQTPTLPGFGPMPQIPQPSYPASPFATQPFPPVPPGAPISPATTTPPQDASPTPAPPPSP